jgi:EmrB/QacA subfamily drug resistance transporter
MNAPAPALDPNRWKVLAIVGAAFLMTVLDVSIVNVALPTIGEKLHFTQDNLQWIITAYAITFGGLLMLGGRAADLLGRRRVFFTGVALFTLASLLCGLASSEGFLIVMRGIQGIGGAIVAPSALSLVSTAFPEGAERNKALGVWGALGGSGAAIGVLLGGVLTKALGWEWIFFVNVPIGVLVLVLTPIVIRESRVDSASRSFDPLGAATLTGGLILLVYSISKAPSVGWGSVQTIGLLIAAAVLIAAFLVIETRVSAPLVPLRIFRLRTVSGANVVGVLLGATIFSMFFLLTIYVQQVLHYSALKTGVTFLATAAVAIVSAGIAEGLVGRLGPKIVMSIGLVLFGVALILYTRIGVNGSYVSDLLPGYLLAGFGMGFAFVPLSILALAGVEERDYGLASGLINTAQNIGGAIGLAIAATLFATRLEHKLTSLLASGTSPQRAAPLAMVAGFHLAFWVLAVFAFVGLAATLWLLRGVAVDADAAEAHATPTTACGFAPNRAATAHISSVLLGGDKALETPGAVPG